MVSDNDERATLGAFGYFCAIVLCCLVVGTLLYNSGREDERRHTAPSSCAQSAKADARRACIGRDSAAAFECVYEKVEAAQEQARGEQDLNAQQKAANAALLSAIIAFFTFILSAVGVWYVRGTLRATLEAVEDTGKATKAMCEANEIAQRSQRPWVSVDCKVSSYEIDGNFATIKHTAFITNQGKMAAGNFCATVRCKFFEHDDIDTKIAAWFEVERRKRQKCKHVLIPSERLSFEGEAMQVINMIAHKDGEVPDRYYVVVLASVQYQAFGSDEWHSTERSFSVGMKDPDIFNEQTMTRILPDGVYSKEIAVRRFRSGLTT